MKNKGDRVRGWQGSQKNTKRIIMKKIQGNKTSKNRRTMRKHHFGYLTENDEENYYNENEKKEKLRGHRRGRRGRRKDRKRIIMKGAEGRKGKEGERRGNVRGD